MIHLVFKTHLDLGFTGYASSVRRQYHEHYIPMALDTGEHFLKEDPDEPAFRWSTGSWLIWDHLNTQPAEKVRRLERAIESGIIAWHALPFTTHTELMSRPLLAEALSISYELDQRFGRTTRAAKMTDVPGHTIGAVEVMADHGVEFLHLGVNAASPVPELPSLFRWQAPNGAEIVVLYQSSYGETFCADGTTAAIAFAHTVDNMGPQNVGQVVETWDRMVEDNPHDYIRASTLDDYWNDLRAHRDKLPVVTQEIGDTWIHGIGSAPRRLSRFLACQRAFDGFSDALTPKRRAFGRKLLEVAEHTWGVDIKTYLRDDKAWDRADFEAARSRDPRFAIVEGAWREQDVFIDEALALLDHTDVALVDDIPNVPTVSGTITPLSEPLQIGAFEAQFDTSTGALLSLRRDGKLLLEARDDGAGIFAYSQRAYSADKVESYLGSYLTHRYHWAILDHTKPGLSNAKTQRSDTFQPTRTTAFVEKNRALIAAEMPSDAVRDFGAPRQVIWDYEAQQDALHLTLHLIGKSANRQPEAGFCHFEPKIGDDSLKVEKMALRLDPLNVPPHGNRQLHAVQAIEVANAAGPLRLETADAALFGLSSQPFLNHTTVLPEPEKGGRFVLFNNKWGTNFSMWTEGDFAFRFKLSFGHRA
ncbi:DUF5054 domain-containing protein [Flavimaricola marinus]|uniref:Glycoside hydrolase family 38 N-terminal domain-containing protein n=1 Tax=Flavimaricola marinus TaxID=1819565 RepID=A0A238LC77_9RHOB|nr:DUF5054 domain-containing protein [Flavimaricola marinus]SMY07299.1 hypothetical protein LOM8899_01432 [Flavimaricola marinus]